MPAFDEHENNLSCCGRSDFSKLKPERREKFQSFQNFPTCVFLFKFGAETER
jgi:hypothetical protein